MNLKVKQLKRSVLVLYYSLQDPAVGCLPKVIVAVVLAYALSPLDLIPDFIPVLGILDDLILLPGLIWLAVHLIPADAFERARRRAQDEPLDLGENWFAAFVIFLLWDAALIGALYILFRYLDHDFSSYLAWLPMAMLGFALVMAQAGWWAHVCYFATGIPPDIARGQRHSSLDQKLLCGSA